MSFHKQVLVIYHLSFNHIEIMSKQHNFWKQIFVIIIGTTISILLTIGSSQLLERRQRAKDRRLTAMMVLSNIENSARMFEQMSDELARLDTVGAWLLCQPLEKLELMPGTELSRLFNKVTSLRIMSHDESAEKIFSNNIDTWKNMGNFQFVDRVGACFSMINNAEKYWGDWVSEMDNAIKTINANPDQYEGKTITLKLLRDSDIRNRIRRIHNFKAWTLYVSELIRYNNRKSMALIGITEEEVRAFTDERNNVVQTDKEIPQAHYTPDLQLDSLTTLSKLSARLDSLEQAARQ